MRVLQQPARIPTVPHPILEALGLVVATLVVLLTSRRLAVIVAAAWPGRPCRSGIARPVVVIVAVRNESRQVRSLLDGLDDLDYPDDKISFVLVNDSSSDETGEILADWVADRANALCIKSEQRVGKAEALNWALAMAPEVDLVAVYDADLVPHPDSLSIMVSALEDREVGAVGGYRNPTNATRNPVTAYGALEAFVHQLVTQAGKERLRLNPTTLGGNCVYRRSAIRQAGGFAAGSFSEDIEISLTLAGAGWRTRFCRNAVARSALVDSLQRYWNQRSRWTRGLYRSTRRASRLEGVVVSAGYLDRLAFIAALALVITGNLHPVWPALYLLTPVAAAFCGLWRADVSLPDAAYILAWSIPMFAVDIAVTLVATFNAFIGRRLNWQTGGSSASDRRSTRRKTRSRVRPLPAESSSPGPIGMSGSEDTVRRSPHRV
jgi:cellulose synthase/poly-beta-1,6-N-acetylglucosamine synthase-like glycosyltransferase